VLAVDAPGGRLIDAGQGSLVIVDLASGQTIGRLGLLFPKNLVVDAQHGRALVFAQDTNHPGHPQLRVLDTQNGRLLTSIPLGPAYATPVRIVVDPSRGLAFTVVGSEHQLQARSTLTGKLVRTFPLPSDLLVNGLTYDPQSHQVFVYLLLKMVIISSSGA
jgi:hypothetical protein